MEDIVSISVTKHRNTSPSHGQQVFPVLDATSPSLNSHPRDVIPNEDFDYKSFTVNYAKRLIEPTCERGSSPGGCKDANIWRVHSITLFNSDKMIVKEWYDTLTKILNGK